ncbi:MAG: non-canonical purine NTP pyrophosphatase, partial [Candidatus Methylomirabilales bacterium]
MKIVLATGNPHKLQEITTILSDMGVDWIPYSTLDEPPPLREEGSSLQENAASKAMVGATYTGLITLAEDSALEVDALGGAPGVRSSRFLGEEATDEERTQEILRQIRTYPWHGRTA